MLPSLGVFTAFLLIKVAVGMQSFTANFDDWLMLGSYGYGYDRLQLPAV
jgi:hypothetical protein